MINRYAILFVLPFLLVLVVIFQQHSDDENFGDSSTQMINAVIGDESFVTMFGEEPAENVPDKIRIRTHLKYVEQKLRQRSISHLTTEQKKNRANYLDLLKEYIQAGHFPHNDGHSDLRRPTFIDDDGNICAVGYLVEQTAGRQTAATINKKYKYAFIQQIDDSQFKEWAQNSGFTIKELAMIQPTYGGHREEPKPRVETGYAAGSVLLTTANVLYISNKNKNPWMFPSSKTAHWFGLTAGTTSILMGAFNLDSNNNVTVVNCRIFGECFDNSYTQERPLRTGISIANIGIGLVNVVRATYHLLGETEPKPKKLSKTEINLTHLQTNATMVSQPVPALKFKLNF